MRFYFILVVLFCSLVITSSSSAEDGVEPVELSLGTMILFAMDQNPDLDIARARREQMEFFTKEAQADFYPKIQATAEAGREYISPTNGSKSNNLAKTSLILNQKIFDGFRATAEVSRRRELKNAADIDVETEKSALILEVIDHYLGVLRYSKLSARTERFTKEIDGVVQTVADLVEAGASGKAMLDYAKSRQASAYVGLNEARSSLNDSLSNLEFLTGPLPEFKAIPPDYMQPNKLDKSFYVDTASIDSLLMKRVKSEIDAMKLQVETEEGSRYPSVDFIMRAEQGYDDGGDVGDSQNLKATLNFTYEIFGGFEKQNRLGRVSSQLKELEYKERKIFEELKRNIDLAYNQLISIQDAIKATNAEISSNRALQRLNRENFKLGEINVIELIEGEERLQGAYARKYRLEYDLYTNMYGLLVTSSIIRDFYFCGACGEEDQPQEHDS